MSKKHFLCCKVTFVKHEGFPSSSQETTDTCEINQTQKTAMVKGERTLSSYSDQYLASDLPSAHDDFKQVCYQLL